MHMKTRMLVHAEDPLGSKSIGFSDPGPNMPQASVQQSSALLETKMGKSSAPEGTTQPSSSSVPSGHSVWGSEMATSGLSSGP